MLFGNDRSTLRKIYFEAWHKFKENLPMEPLEKQLAHTIEQHPKYHDIFNNPEKYLNYDFSVDQNEANPFLHLGLHTTILEQVSTNRPEGITQIYKALLQKFGNSLEVEHQMINVLVDTLYEIQNTGEDFNEKNYLEKIRKLV